MCHHQALIYVFILLTFIKTVPGKEMRMRLTTLRK